MLNDIVRYFDLQSRQRRPKPSGAKLPPGAARMAGTDRHHAAVLPQYGAVALGVLADPMLRQYIETKSFALDASTIAAGTGFALLMAIILLPAVYKNAFDPDKPLLVQLCALFTSGVGWQSLFQTATTAAGG